MFKDLWLDLELRKDIDDYVTLIYAIESGADIKVLSVNNPSINELKLFNYTIDKFNLDVSFIISGNITEYSADEDIHPSLMKLIENYSNITHEHISSLPIDKFDINKRKHPLRYFDENRIVLDLSKDEIVIFPMTVFCGGSLTTLSILLEIYSPKSFKACIQGGYASYKIVSPEFLLKKFKKREKVPTWNLNLDIEATKKVLDSDIEINFVSKNICHDSWVSLDDLNDGDSFFNEVMKNYFEINEWDKKCMHDLLAFLSIDSDIVNMNLPRLKTRVSRP